MNIWIDADSCPRRIREIICKAARRTGVPARFVANREIPLSGDRGRFIHMVAVDKNENDADGYIIDHAVPGDLIVTRDIPLAAELVERGLRVLNDRGVVYSSENIRERLSVRNFMQGLREAGLPQAEAGQFGERDVRQFANTFDHELSRAIREAGAEGKRRGA